MSVEITSSWPGRGRDQRAVVADAEQRVRGGAREMARDEFEFRGHGIRAFDLRGPQHGGQLVQHAVDELVAVGAAVGLGQFDGFVDDHAVGCFRMQLEFAGAQQQDAALDRRDFIPGAVDMRRKVELQRFCVLSRLASKVT
jgi:hypothetical protein